MFLTIYSSLYTCHVRKVPRENGGTAERCERLKFAASLTLNPLISVHDHLPPLAVSPETEDLSQPRPPSTTSDLCLGALQASLPYSAKAPPVSPTCSLPGRRGCQLSRTEPHIAASSLSLVPLFLSRSRFPVGPTPPFLIRAKMAVQV